MAYCIGIKSCVNSNPKDVTTWYYYGWKNLRGYGRVRDMDDNLYDDVKKYKNKKTAERVAKTILEEKQKGYPWMQFSAFVMEIS